MKKLLLISFFIVLSFVYSQKVKAATLDLINFNNDSETYIAGQTYELQWRQENIKGVSVFIMKGDSNTSAWNTTAVNVDQDAEIGTYELFIPEILNGYYQIMLTGYFINAEDGKYSMQERSDDSFNVKQDITINVLKPVAGQTLQAGEEYLIQWERQGGPELLSLNLDLYKGEELVKDLDDGSSYFDNQHNWTVPVDVASGDDYRIRVSQYSNTYGSYPINPFPVEGYSDYFTIESDLNLDVSFYLPQNMLQGNNYNVSWNSQCSGGLYALWLVIGENDKDYGYPYLLQQIKVEDSMAMLMGEEQIAGYWMTPNNGSMMVEIPEERYYNYGSIAPVAINYPIRYTTDGHNMHAQTINNQYERDSFRRALPDGQYRFYIEIDGKYNGQYCELRSFSDYFTIGSANTNTDDDTDSNDNNEDDSVTDEITPEIPTTHVDYNLTNRLKGRILLQVEAHGEAWYVRPEDGRRMYMEDGDAAYGMMRDLGLGITNADLSKIPIGFEDRFECLDSDGDGLCNQLEDGLGTDKYKTDSDEDGYDDGTEVRNNYNPLGAGSLNYDLSLADRLKGKILLQVQTNGEAWYINPEDGKRYYMPDGPSAYQIMKFLSLGITNTDLAKIASN